MKTPTDRLRGGSALLIVLGMLSFMIFSGLAFSVYMRQTRLPSSFLRRTVAARQLAKAAMAMAIDEIDAAIANNPHPGIGNATVSKDAVGRITRVGHNRWNHRVFIGAETNSVPDGGTVATLTLEGLAYLPPAIVDQVRFYSRHTPTAGWRKFNWDAGRYAFTAVDVSDYFDVNRIRSTLPRTSAAVGRVDFTHLFEEGYHDSAPSEAAIQDWEQLFTSAKARVADPDDYGVSYGNGCVPFVSMADFNLALGLKQIGNMRSGFCQYFQNNGNEGFYTGMNQNQKDPVLCAYRGMTFVADGWYPRDEQTSANGYECDLALWQPFGPSDTRLPPTAPMTLAPMGITAVSKTTSHRVRQFLPAMGAFALLDYLDLDSRPISLAIPTVERNPMICAVNVGFPGVGQLQLTADSRDSPGVETGKTREMTRTSFLRLNGGALAVGSPLVSPLALYPFRHRDGLGAAGYKIDGVVRLFLTRDGDDVPLITGSSGTDDLALSADFGTTFSLQKDAILAAPFGPNPMTVTVSASAADREEAVRNALVICPAMPARFDGAAAEFSEADDKFFVKVVRKWQQTKVGGEMSTRWEPEEPPAEWGAGDAFESRLRFVKSDGRVASNDEMREAVLGGDGTRFRVNYAVTVRLTSMDNQVVDMVPANFHDDSEQFKMPGSDAAAMLFANKFGMGSYILKGRIGGANDELVLNRAAFDAKSTQSVGLTASRPTMMVADPRFNHDPQSWVASGGDANSLREDWMRFASGLYAADGRDGDPFLEVSDQGYMQSIYELAHIMRFSNGIIEDADASSPPGDTHNGDYRAPTGEEMFGDLEDVHQNRFELYGTEDGFRNRRLMWRTYDPLSDDFEGLKVTSGSGGLRVNPYGPKDDVEPLMAAFANTPHGWRYASTNEAGVTYSCTAVEYCQKYAWNQYSASEDGRIAWDDLRAFARNFRARLFENGSDDWVAAYDDVWLNGGIRAEDAATTAFIPEADRKFLYGFWRECFSARQQLFLIFVRAEPIMMGGGVSSSAPPQLGSRAVALVWRDPRKTRDRAPHACRILFYHQLD